MDEEHEDQEQEYQPDCWRCGSSVDVEACEGCGMSFCRRCWKTHDEDKCKEGDDAHDHE